jgi:hypothetical protein
VASARGGRLRFGHLVHTVRRRFRSSLVASRRHRASGRRDSSEAWYPGFFGLSAVFSGRAQSSGWLLERRQVRRMPRSQRHLSVDWASMKRKGQPVHQRWCVAFLDLLGQRKSLIETEIPIGETDPGMIARSVDATQQSIAVILRFHTLYDQFRRAYLQRQPADLARLPTGVCSRAERWRLTTVRHVPFSDGLVVYFALKPDSDHSPALALHFLTMAAGMLAMLQSASGTPIRGGIETGTGIQTQGQLFGAAVAKAYELEAYEAKSPRILIGNELLTYLETKLNLPADDVVDKWNRRTAERIRDTLFQDVDGRWAVDFLGPMFCRIPGGGPPPPVSAVHRGYGAVKDALSYWRGKQCSSDAEETERRNIEEKYRYLVSYFESRSTLWNLQL